MTSTASDLTQVEADVLRCLSESRVTASVVTLAADLWRTTGDWMAEDCMPLIAWVLDGLSAKGLVVYRETPMSVEVASKYNKGSVPVVVLMPTAIRLTGDGWAMAGYPRMTVEVGSLDRHRSPGRTGDATDYKNHSPEAIGGPIEKEDFATHRQHYPHHIHMYYDTGEDDMPRTYVKVTPEIEAAVIYARNELGLMGYTDIAAKTGVPERTVKYVLTDLPRLRRIDDDTAPVGEKMSLKERIVVTLTELGEVKDVRELSRILGRADSDHDIVHVLHSLHTQGKVDFREDSHGNAPTRIHMTRQGLGQGKTKVNGETKPEREKVEVTDRLTAYAAPLPDPEPTIEVIEATGETPKQGYPLLDELLDRERKRMDEDSKGMAYITAAEAIEAIDPVTARELMAKAEALNVPMPSPIEREYMTYVAEHP